MPTKRRRRAPVTLSAVPNAAADLPFLSPQLKKEYVRCCGQLGREANATAGEVDSRTVLRAHFLVAEYFLGPNRGMSAVGPRNVQLLQSAVSRQYVEYQGYRKWTDPFDVAATLFFGLVKNHPFHDANKRTALLTTLFSATVARSPSNCEPT